MVVGIPEAKPDMRRWKFQRESWKEKEMDPSFVSELFDHKI